VELHGGTTTTVGIPTYYLFAGGQRVAALEAGEFTYYTQDHLGGTALATDDSGTVVQLYDYYPYGSELLNTRPTGADVPSEHSFTDKELDGDLGLYYFEARWYDSEIGRFSGQDPAQLDGRVFKLIQDPQSLNFYAYSRNNPIILVDRNGEYWETAIDIIFFTLSTRDFYLNPSLTTGAWATLDALGVALPVPAVAGYLKNGVRASKIFNYFGEVAQYTGKSITQIAETFGKNAFFKQGRLTWSAGKAGDSLGSLVGHYEKHGDEVGAKTVEEYYNKANDFVEEFKEGGSNLIETQTRGDGTVDTIYRNLDTGEKAVTSEGGAIRTYYVE